MSVAAVRQLHQERPRIYAIGDSDLVWWEDGQAQYRRQPRTRKELDAAMSAAPKTQCAHCHTPYPCPTIRALNERKPS